MAVARGIRDGVDTLRRVVTSGGGRDDRRRLSLTPPLTGLPDAAARDGVRALSLSTIGELLPSLLHELRNPLAAITSSVELLVEETGPGELNAELSAILAELRRMDLGFQGLGMIGRRLRTLRPQPIEPSLQDVVRVMRIPAGRAGVILRLDVEPMPLLAFNPAVVRAMLFNLVNNAIGACREGDEVRVRARLVDRDRAFELSVGDTGAGMSPEVLARCTEPFFSTRAHATGLGLAMCHEAVERAGGRMAVASTSGRGTRVVLTVPLADPGNNA